MRRDKYQRQAYALRRMSKAVDRALLANDPAIKSRAGRWAYLWREYSGFRPDLG
jgi:hypothetical protein